MQIKGELWFILLTEPLKYLSPLKGQCRQLKEMENDRMQSAAKLRLSTNCTSIALVAPERGDVAQRQRGL